MSGHPVRKVSGAPRGRDEGNDWELCDQYGPQCHMTLTEMTCLSRRDVTTFYAYCPLQGDGILVDLKGSARDPASLERVKQQAHQRLSGQEARKPSNE